MGGRPSIDFALEEAVHAGLTPVVVTGPHKSPLDAYVTSGACAHPARLVAQREPRGLGDAVLVGARDHAGEPVAVLLPDELLLGGSRLLRSMLDLAAREQRSVVSVMEVARDDVSAYGCARLTGVEVDGEPLAGGFVEKPMPESAPSRLVLTGRYVLGPDVIEEIEDTPPDATGEIQLTGALDRAARRRAVICVRVRRSDMRLDVGTWPGWLHANEVAFELGFPSHPRVPGLTPEVAARQRDVSRAAAH